MIEFNDYVLLLDQHGVTFMLSNAYQSHQIAVKYKTMSTLVGVFLYGQMDPYPYLFINNEVKLYPPLSKGTINENNHDYLFTFKGHRNVSLRLTERQLKNNLKEFQLNFM